jgi:hypothetical protein
MRYAKQIPAADWKKSAFDKKVLRTKSSNVEVLEIRFVNKQGFVRGFGKIKIGRLLINGLRIIREPGKEPWVSMRSAKFKNR